MPDDQDHQPTAEAFPYLWGDDRLAQWGLESFVRMSLPSISDGAGPIIVRLHVTEPPCLVDWTLSQHDLQPIGPGAGDIPLMRGVTAAIVSALTDPDGPIHDKIAVARDDAQRARIPAWSDRSAAPVPALPRPKARIPMPPSRWTDRD